MERINEVLNDLGITNKKTIIATLPFSDIDYIDTYDWYDGPINYSIQGDDDQLYIVNWAGWTTETEASIWLYLPVNEEYLNKYKEDGVTLKEIIKETETEFYLESVLNGEAISYFIHPNTK